MTTANFVCVCPPKELKFGPDNAFHRADHREKLETVLHGLKFNSDAAKYCFLPGGGMAVAGDVDISSFETCATAFKGKLANYAYLVRRYFEAEVQELYGSDPPLSLIKQMPPFSVSTLICKLYRMFGPKLVHKLRGTFAFVCYDSVMVRVFAARDPYGKIEVTLCRTDDGSIVVSSGGVLPADSHDIHELPPGYYKYGWHCEPLKFADSPCVAQKSADTPTVDIRSCKTEVVEAPPSVDEVATKKKGKTRRGTRGGRNKRKSNSPLETPQVPAAQSKTVSWRKSEPIVESAPEEPVEEELEVVIGNVADHLEPAVADELQQLPEPLSAQFRSGTIDEASLRLLSNLLYSSPCALVVTDASQEDDPTVYVNRVFELQTGYSMEECIGKNCRFLQAVHRRDRTPSFASMSIRKALESGTKRTVRILNYHKDGTPMWNKLSIVPLRNGEGKITHHVGMQTFTVAEEIISAGASPVVAALDGSAGLRKMQRTSLMSKSKSCSDLAGLGGLVSNAMPSMAY